MSDSVNEAFIVPKVVDGQGSQVVGLGGCMDRLIEGGGVDEPEGERAVVVGWPG